MIFVNTLARLKEVFLTGQGNKFTNKVNLSENSIMVKKKKESLYKMKVCMKDNLKIIKNKTKENLCGKMVKFLKDIFRIIK